MEDILLSLASYGYIGLFVASFLAATILPLSSEIVFTTLLYTTRCNVWGLVAVATVGNTLGALTCYALGRMGKIEWIEKYLRVSKADIEKWNTRINKYATGASFFTFIPLIGDIIAVCVGYLRTPLPQTALFIFLGKLSRYLAWMFLTYWIW
jgi:membrane protein YqaA with SNARE-associated domain